MKHRNHFIRLVALGAAAVIGCLAAGCTSKNDPTYDENATPDRNKSLRAAYEDKDYGFQLEPPAAGETIAILHTSMGDMSIRFFPDGAPKAVENFITHARDGYYDGLTFHRVIKDFMIQGGDPNGNGTGGESVWDGKFEDEFCEKLMNLRGSLAMANSGENTNGSQFFINQAPASAFDKSSYTTRASNYKSQYEDYKKQYKEYYAKNKAQLVKTYPTWQEFFTRQYTLYPDPRVVPDAVWTLYQANGGNISLDGAWRQYGGHTVFGQVFEGLDVLDAIAAVPSTGEKDSNGDDKNIPSTTITIDSIDIVEYRP